MKIYGFMFLIMVALAGCTTTYKGSIKGASHQEPSKSVSYMVSQAGINSTSVSVDK